MPIVNKKTIIIMIILVFVVWLLYYIFSSYHHAKQLTLYGNVDIRDVNLGFRVSGRLISLKVDEGDQVHPGQLIGQLDPEPYIREARAADAAVNQHKASLAYAETVYAREKKLYGTGASTVDQYENALDSKKSAKANLDKAVADLSVAILRVQDTHLYSPSEGVVLTRAVEPGTMLAIGDTVISVTLINPIWVRAYVTETELGQAKPGTHVTVYSDSFKKSFAGIIGFVSPTAEFTPKTVQTPDLRTELIYRLRIVMQDPHHELRQGMPVTVIIPTG